MAARVLGRTRLGTWDAVPVALALAHGALLLAWPSIPLVAVGLWWNANTISHHFIHRPFFRTRTLNAGFSCYLSLVLGFPQSFWRARHFAHHLAIDGRRRRDDLRPAPLDFIAAGTLWISLAVFLPGFMLTVYLPGVVLGLGLCYLQGHYEHSQATVSHYGWLYNFLMFNDGYHQEHHARPAASWRELPAHRVLDGKTSCWPAVLRWLEVLNLCTLERIVLRCSMLQRFVLARHERAFRRLLVGLPGVREVAIVGGGLFPRTALILRRLLPEANLVLIDHSESNLDIARRFLSLERGAGGRQKVTTRRQKAESRGQNGAFNRNAPNSLPPSAFCLLPSASQGSQEYLNQRFEPGVSCDADLLVIPLAFEGDRRALYEQPPVSTVLVHDWIWNPQGSSVVVSWFLLKRLNLVKR